MTTTTRYLVVVAICVVAVVLLVVLWRSLSAASMRRVGRELADVNPRVRRKALAAAHSSELAPLADRLLQMTRTERDPLVLEALRGLVRATAWQPAVAPAMVELRAWAGVLAEPVLPASEPGFESAPPSTSPDRAIDLDGLASDRAVSAAGLSMRAPSPRADGQPDDLDPAPERSAAELELDPSEQDDGDALTLVASSTSSTVYDVAAVHPTSAPDEAATAAGIIAALAAEASRAAASDGSTADMVDEIGATREVTGGVEADRVDDADDPWSILSAAVGAGTAVESGAPSTPLAGLSDLGGVEVRRGAGDRLVVSIDTSKSASRPKSKSKKHRKKEQR